MSIVYEGSGLRDDRIEIVERALDLVPAELLVHGVIIRIGNEFFPARSPRTSMATVKWEGQTPVIMLKGSGFYWKKTVMRFGPNGRLLSVDPLGMVMHEFYHVAQKLLPEIEDLFDNTQRRAWSYAQNPGGWQTEGGPSIFSAAYGGQFEHLGGNIQRRLTEWVIAKGIHIPVDWIGEPMTTAPDLPSDFPFPTIWQPAHESNYHKAGVGYGGRTNEPVALCYHTPEEDWDDNEQTPRYFQLPQANASTGYYGDSDGDMYQMVRDVDMPWAQGVKSEHLLLPRPSWWKPEYISYNACMLSIEIEGRAASIGRTFLVGSRQFRSVVAWAAQKSVDFDIPTDRDHHIGHGELTTQRVDPGAAFPWDALMLHIEAAIAELKGEEETIPEQGSVWTALREHHHIGTIGSATWKEN